MAEQAESSVCPKCNELERRVAALESQLADVLSRLAAALKNSGNSSKPPSSDIVKAAVVGLKKKQKKRKKGGQPGHPREIKGDRSIYGAMKQLVVHIRRCERLTYAEDGTMPGTNKPPPPRQSFLHQSPLLPEKPFQRQQASDEEKTKGTGPNGVKLVANACG